MKFLGILGRIIKYYILLHIFTFFIYIYFPSIATIYYTISLTILVVVATTKVSVKNFIFLNIVLASLIYTAYIVGPLSIPIILLIGVAMLRDILLLLRC